MKYCVVSLLVSWGLLCLEWCQYNWRHSKNNRPNWPGILLKTTKCTRPTGSCTFVGLWKIYSCLFIPNSTRNHVITYTWCLEAKVVIHLYIGIFNISLLVSLTNTNKYRRWGLINFELIYFGSALLSRCLLCPCLKWVDLRLTNWPFSSASRSVF